MQDCKHLERKDSLEGLQCVECGDVFKGDDAEIVEPKKEGGKGSGPINMVIEERYPGDEPPKKEPKVAASVIAVDNERQIIVARDQVELYRMVQMFMKGTAFPKTIDFPAFAR